MNVFDYSDYRAFLRDWIELQKTQGDFSYAKFAKKAGFEARSFLRLVVTNKRKLSDDGIKRVLKGLEIEPAQANGFEILVKANQAPNLDDRLRLWEHFISLKPKTHKAQVVQDSFHFLSRFINMPLLNLLRQPGVSQNPQDLATMLNTNVDRVLEALQSHARLGLIQYKPDGTIVVVHELPATTDDLPNVAIQSFHKQALENAIEAIKLPVTEREFQSVAIALSPEALTHLKKRIRQVADEIEQLYGGSQKDSEKVYLCNLNLIPVTTSFIRRPKNLSRQKDGVQVDSKEIPHEVL